MEARVEQFQRDAARPQDARTPRDIDRLRKFLYKNQEHRFTDREQSHLFQAVQLYVTAYTPSSSSSAARSPEEDNPAAELLEDALKMPFTVFTTSQKKTMLKWLDKLCPGSSSSGMRPPQVPAEQCVWYSVIDCSSSALEVMDAEGNTATLTLSSCSPEVQQQVAAAWDAGEEVRVQLTAAAGDGSREVVAVKTG